MSTSTMEQPTKAMDAVQPQVNVERLHDRYFQIRGEVYERMNRRGSSSRVWSKVPYVLVIPFIGVLTGSLSFFFYSLLGILGAAVVFGVSRLLSRGETE